MVTQQQAQTAQAPAVRPRRRLPAPADLLWSLALAVLAVALSSLAVLNGPAMSGLDEHTHLDYAWSLSRGEIPHDGSELSAEVMQEWSCRGQAGIEDALPSCEQATEGTVEADDYPARGENYNSWHPPLYYAITAVLAGAMESLPLGLTFTTAARLTGAAWLAAAVVAMFAVLRSWRLPGWLAAAGAATLLSVPSLVHASSTVSNDAPAALVGVGALWILTRVFRGQRLGWVLPTVLAVLAAATKLMSTVAILTAVGVVALSAIPALRERRTGDALRRVAVAVGPVVGIAAVALGWSAFQGGRAEPGWTSPISGVNTAEVVGAPFDEWAPTLLSSFGLVGDYYLQPALASIAIGAAVATLRVLLTAAPFTAIAVFERGRPERVLGWASLIGAVAVPLLVQGQELVRGDGGYFRDVTSRYAVTLVPMTVAALVLVAHERRFRAAAVAVPVLGYLAMLLSFVGVF